MFENKFVSLPSHLKTIEQMEVNRESRMMCNTETSKVISRTDPVILLGFGIDYLKYGHDKAPKEMEAERSRNAYNRFVKFIDKEYGKNSIEILFNSNLTDAQKIKQIDQWWQNYNNYGNK